jgi:hypothetical protein
MERKFHPPLRPPSGTPTPSPRRTITSSQSRRTGDGFLPPYPSSSSSSFPRPLKGGTDPRWDDRTHLSRKRILHSTHSDDDGAEGKAERDRSEKGRTRKIRRLLVDDKYVKDVGENIKRLQSRESVHFVCFREVGGRERTRRRDERGSEGIERFGMDSLISLRFLSLTSAPLQTETSTLPGYRRPSVSLTTSAFIVNCQRADHVRTCTCSSFPTVLLPPGSGSPTSLAYSPLLYSSSQSDRFSSPDPSFRRIGHASLDSSENEVEAVEMLTSDFDEHAVVRASKGTSSHPLSCSINMWGKENCMADIVLCTLYA